METLLNSSIYSQTILPIIKGILSVVAALALPIFIGSMIIRLFFIIIRKPLSYRNMPIIGVILAFLLGFGICMAIPYLKSAELDLINSIPFINK